ncbi:MAG: putative ABC transporter ATP-binding protein [Candidatus Heimdallarchaeota archaeon LC_2]|nr:MAG: putative ABC transporter ATP-binding protein [Candidatus Heimdallarchaeota archaeon LC_2]
MGWVTEGLDRADYDRTYSDKDLLKRIIGYFKSYKIFMTLITISVIGVAFINAFLPVVIAGMIDDLDVNKNSNIQGFIYLLGALYVSSFVSFAIMEIFSAKAVQGAVRDLRRDTFNALLVRDMSFFDKQPSGKLASRVTNDTNEFATTVTLTSNLVAQLFSMVFILYFLSTRSLKLTAVTVFFIPFVVFVALSYRKIARKVSLSSQRVIAKVNALIQETTTGISVAKSFRAEKAIYNEFDEMNKQNYRISLKRQITFVSIFPILTMISALIIASVAYFGALEVIQVNNSVNNSLSIIPGPELTIGDWFLFIQSVQWFVFPLIQISSFWSQFQLGLAAAERTFSIIDTENEVLQTGSENIENLRGEIEFRDLCFGYNEEITVLNRFNLHIKPGENIAIVGHTGAGKTTLGKLIARYYEFQDGNIFIDGHNIRSLDLENYRDKLAIISQDVFLWNGTIRENLTYGVPDKSSISDAVLWDTLRKVEAADWISKLDDGLDTHIGERGSRISMGQRQLLSFARILLQDTMILIMDEATASVDPLTEVKIQRVTDKILEGRTSIIIAHRLSTIRNVDRIIVMKDGEIIEEGNHHSLLDQKGHYAELYNTYFRHQSLSYIESISEL